MRIDGRNNNQIRPVSIETDYIIHPEGSVLISMGDTKVLCNATVEDCIPRWMKEQEDPGGWVTGEYSMLPRSTNTRNRRETSGLSGRTQEIKRLIGRSLRQAVNLNLLGERTITLDCDVLQADGGTRTASITGGYLALRIALDKLIKSGELPKEVLKTQVAAISVGICKGELITDLCYAEDSNADVDANIVMNSDGRFIEIQSTGEKNSFSSDEFQGLLKLGQASIEELFKFQTEAF